MQFAGELGEDVSRAAAAAKPRRVHASAEARFAVSFFGFFARQRCV
jgi:hypothetical protein